MAKSWLIHRNCPLLSNATTDKTTSKEPPKWPLHAQLCLSLVVSWESWSKKPCMWRCKIKDGWTKIAEVITYWFFFQYLYKLFDWERPQFSHQNSRPGPVTEEAKEDLLCNITQSISDDPSSFQLVKPQQPCPNSSSDPASGVGRLISSLHNSSVILVCCM